MTSTSGCCGVTLRHGVILILTANIILNCCGVGFFLFYSKKLDLNTFFHDEEETSMAYIFILIEIAVLFRAIISAFGRRSSMLTFATMMLLLESYFIINGAVRAYYKSTLWNTWQSKLQPGILGLLHGEWKKYFGDNKDELMYCIFVAIFYSIYSLIFVLKLCSASVVNNYKNQINMIHMENTFHRVKTMRNPPSSSTRPTSYVYTTMNPSAIADSRFE